MYRKHSKKVAAKRVLFMFYFDRKSFDQFSSMTGAEQVLSYHRCCVYWENMGLTQDSS